MTTLERLLRKHEKAKRTGHSLLDEMHADDTPEERRAELRTQFEAAMADVDRLEGEIEEARRLNDAADYRVIRAEAAIAGDRGDGPEGQATAENLVRRRGLLLRQSHGERLSDEETLMAARVFPGEDVSLRYMAERAANGRKSFLSDEERQRHEDFREVRAVAGGYDLTAQDGAEVVPDILESRIRAQKSDNMRPLATDDLVSVNTRMGQGKASIVTLDRASAAAPTAAGADAAISKPATREIELTPKKYSRYVPFAAELFISPYTDLEQKVIMQFAQAFGLAFNTDRTIGGNGSSATQINGISGASKSTSGAGKNSITVATAATIVEADITNLISELPEEYHNQPNTRIMFNRSTELALYVLRSNGERVFDIDPNSRKLIMPLGFMYEVNSALQSLGAADRRVALAVDLSQYEVLRALGGMRIAMDYLVRSDQFEIAMFDSTDGQLAFQSAHKRLIDKA